MNLGLEADKSWKYNAQLLDPNSDEFKFVENFFETTATKSERIGHPEVLQIYKVVEQNKGETDGGSKNFMLFHGTTSNPALILQKGFINSTHGKFGRGVYMTDCSDFAALYAKSYIFVNEVLESRNLKTIVHDHGYHGYSGETAEFAFAKHVRGVERVWLGEEEYKTDVQGRRYRNVASHGIMEEEFVADSELVVPRYLIRVKEEKRVRFKLNTVKKQILNFERFGIKFQMGNLKRSLLNRTTNFFVINPESIIL